MSRRIYNFFLSGEWVSYFYVVIVVITGYEVMMRYLFNAPTIWVHETSIMLASSAFLIGGFYVLRERDHIRISFVYYAVPVGLRKWLDRLGSLIAAAYLGMLSYSAYLVMTLSWRFGETSGTAWNSPMPVILKTVLFVCASAMALLAVIRIFVLPSDDENQSR